MKKLGEWWYAYLVCRKYKLSYSPFKSFDKGSYNWAIHLIEVNPLSKNFMTIFLHEVGHHVHHERVNYYKFLPYTKDSVLIVGEGWDVFKSLEAEWWASRFAAKTRKANRNHLTKCFHTYTGSIFRHSSKSAVSCQIAKVVDASHKGWLKINK